MNNPFVIASETATCGDNSSRISTIKPVHEYLESISGPYGASKGSNEGAKVRCCALPHEKNDQNDLFGVRRKLVGASAEQSTLTSCDCRKHRMWFLWLLLKHIKCFDF